MSEDFEEFLKHADRGQFQENYASQPQQPQQPAQPPPQQQQPSYQNNGYRNQQNSYQSNSGYQNRQGGNGYQNRGNNSYGNRGGYKRNNDRPRTNINMEEDGVSHINVYTRAKTELGRDLSHFSLYGFTHPTHGTFLTLEGYWHWLNTGKTEDKFRRVYGSTAKKMAKEMEPVRLPFDEFKKLIEEAHVLRFEQNFKLKADFIKSSLPFMHYYWYGQEPNVNVVESKSGWVIEMLENLRQRMKAAHGQG